MLSFKPQEMKILPKMKLYQDDNCQTSTFNFDMPPWHY